MLPPKESPVQAAGGRSYEPSMLLENPASATVLKCIQQQCRPVIHCTRCFRSAARPLQHEERSIDDCGDITGAFHRQRKKHRMKRDQIELSAT